MLESPLVPDGPTPGTQAPLRSERPLTRREIRERDAHRAEPVDHRVDSDSAFAVSGEPDGFDALFPGLTPAKPTVSGTSVISAVPSGRDRGARVRARDTWTDEGRGSQAGVLRAPEADHEAWLARQRVAQSLVAEQQAELARAVAEQALAAAEQQRVAEQSRVAEERAAAERAAAQRAAEEREAAQRAAEEAAAQQRVVREEAARRLAAQRAEQERVAEQEWVAHQREAERRAAEQRLAERRAEQERIAEQQWVAQQQRAAEERAAQQRAAEDRAAQQRAAEERAGRQHTPEQRSSESVRGAQGAERPDPDPEPVDEFSALLGVAMLPGGETGSTRVVDVPDEEFAASARRGRREPRAPKKGRLGRKARKAEVAASAPDVEPAASAFDLLAAFDAPDVDGAAGAPAAAAPAVAPVVAAPTLAPVAAAPIVAPASARALPPAASGPDRSAAVEAPHVAPAAPTREQAGPAAAPGVPTAASVFDSIAAFDAPDDAHHVPLAPFRPAVARTATARAAASRPPARRGSLRKAIVSRSISLVAMGFAAMLAIATSVPSLSLLTPEDVQAMALNSPAGTVDGQRVDITGGASAAGVGREKYQAQTIEEYAAAAGIRPEATFTNDPNGTIQWPFAVGVHIGDRFGYRDCAGCSSDHHGQDFNPGLGAEIQAIADGVVSESTDDGGSLGVVTMIDHVIDGQVITSVYAHMEYGSRRFEVGDTVKVADIVGNTGDTGMSTGPHLHFEIRIGGKDGYWVDPLVWLYENTN